MNRNKVISLADAPGCPAAVTAFYDRFRERITGIEIVEGALEYVIIRL